MATLPSNSFKGSSSSSKRSRPYGAPMSPLQLQAYLLARETLRRLKGAPCVARDPAPQGQPPANG
jgi:hypothetical protein